MRRSWGVWVGALVSCAAVAACADLLGFKELEQPDDANVPDGASNDVNEPDVDTCAHTRWPGESDASAPVADASTYIVALKDIYFSTTADGGTPTFGYDLDDRCTSTNNPSSASCTAQSIIQDGVGGIDNTSIQIMSTLITKFSFASSLTDTAINQNIANGNFSLVLHVYGYGGGLNQSRTTGLSLGVQGATALVGTPPAKIDGTDEWVVDIEDSVASTNNTPKASFPADVVNGVLVSTFNNAPVTLHVLIPSGDVSGELTVTLDSPIMTGTLVKRSDGNYDVASGIIAGRWKASDILNTLAGLDVFGSPLCTYLDGGAQSYAAQSVCPYLDITSSGTDNDTAPCDAISVALGFDAVSASIATNPGSFNVTPTPCPFDAGGAGCN